MRPPNSPDTITDETRDTYSFQVSGSNYDTITDETRDFVPLMVNDSFTDETRDSHDTFDTKF